MRRESDAPKLAWNKCGDKWLWRSTNGNRQRRRLAVTDAGESQLEGSSRCLCGALAVKLRDLRALCLPPYQQTSAGLWPSAYISVYKSLIATFLNLPGNDGCYITKCNWKETRKIMYYLMHEYKQFISKTKFFWRRLYAKSVLHSI